MTDPRPIIRSLFESAEDEEIPVGPPPDEPSPLAPAGDVTDAPEGKPEGEPEPEEAPAEEDDLQTKLVAFFRDNESPTDEAVHAFAEQNGMEADAMEEEIYKLLHSFATLGRNAEKADDEFDAEELRMGIEVEKEHTDNEHIAKMIAKDHLVELPNYYTRLKEMEGDESETPEEPSDNEKE